MMKAIFSGLVGMLLFLLVLFGLLLFNPNDNDSESGSYTKPTYHIQLLVQNSEESFWKQLMKGATDAGEKFNVYVEFVKLPQKDANTVNAAVEKAMLSKVDGIALQATDDEIKDKVTEAKMDGLKVVTYENYYYNMPNIPVIGSNSYYIGIYAGEMAAKALGNKGNVAVILNDANNQTNEKYNNLIVQGITQAFSLYTISLTNDHIYTIDTGMFEKEKLESMILPDIDDIDLIICTDEKITPSVAQMISEEYLVKDKDIEIIGYGDRAQTLNFIERGIIYGSVCPDAYQIGYSTVKQLKKSLDGEQISDFDNTELYKIDYTNVWKFEKSNEDEK